MTYYKRYTTWLEKAGVGIDDLPLKLTWLIDKYEHALGLWELAAEQEQVEYLPFLEQSDAYISALIYREYKGLIDASKLNKAKLLALKAKALNINLND